MLIEISSHQRPSRQIASRARPSTTNPTDRYDRIARSLNENTVSPTRCSPSAAEGVVDHQPGRLGAVAVAPGVLLADRDVEQRRAVVASSCDSAHVPISRSSSRTWIAIASESEPSARAAKNRSISSRPHRAVLVARQADDLGVGVPALEGAEVGRARAGGGRRARPSATRETSVAGPIGGDGIPSPPCVAGARSRSASPPRPGPPRRPPSSPTTSPA